MKNCCSQCLSSKGVSSNPNVRSGEQKRPSLLRSPLLRASSEALTHTGETYGLLGLHANFAKRERTAQHNSLFTENGLREILKTKDYYGAGSVFSSILSFIDESLGFKGSCKLNVMNVHSSNNVNQVLVDQRDERSVS